MSNHEGGPVDETPDESLEAAPGEALAETDASDDAADARRLVRQKAKRVTAKQRVKRVVVWVVVAVVLLALLGAAGLWIYRNVVPEVTQPVPEPGNVVDGAISFDDKDLSSMLGDEAPDEEEPPTDKQPDDGGEPERVQVDVYVDYLSPESGAFHTANAAQLAQWVGEDAISLTYHPVSLMSGRSNGTKYSERAMGAVACMASGDPDHVVAYNDALLRDQPEIDSPGFTSEQLAATADEIGTTNPDVLTCIRDDKYAEWARDTTSALTEGGLPGQGDQQLTGAPMVLVSGVPYTGAIDDPGELSQFVLTVESDEYFQTSTPEPTE